MISAPCTPTSRTNLAIVPEDLDGERDCDPEQRTWSEDEKREILCRARDIIAQGDDEKQEITRRDGDLDEKRTWSDAEKREILRCARENVARRDASTAMVTKGQYSAPAARQADAASEARQPRQKRQWRRRAEASADDAYFDPIESIGWPEPAKESKLDTCLEDLVADHVMTSFAEQHRICSPTHGGRRSSARSKGAE